MSAAIDLLRPTLLPCNWTHALHRLRRLLTAWHGLVFRRRHHRGIDIVRRLLNRFFGIGLAHPTAPTSHSGAGRLVSLEPALYAIIVAYVSSVVDLCRKA
jgi:hypothetical protein